jgi:hypothetical protein
MRDNASGHLPWRCFLLRRDVHWSIVNNQAGFCAAVTSDPATAAAVSAEVLAAQSPLSITLAGAVYGLLVHWRVFPVVYGPSLVLFFWSSSRKVCYSRITTSTCTVMCVCAEGSSPLYRSLHHSLKIFDNERKMRRGQYVERVACDDACVCCSSLSVAKLMSACLLHL